jgi:hypothetical protein
MVRRQSGPHNVNTYTWTATLSPRSKVGGFDFNHQGIELAIIWIVNSSVDENDTAKLRDWRPQLVPPRVSSRRYSGRQHDLLTSETSPSSGIGGIIFITAKLPGR